MKKIHFVAMFAAAILIAACNTGGKSVTGSIDLSSVSNALLSDQTGPGAGAKYLLTVSEPDGLVIFQQGGNFPAAKIAFTIEAGPSRLINVIITDSTGTTVYYNGSTVADLLPNSDNAVTVNLEYAISVNPRTATVQFADSINITAAATDPGASPVFTWTLVEGSGYGTLSASGSTAKYTAPMVMPASGKATIQVIYTDKNGRKNIGSSVVTIQSRLFPPDILAVTPQAGQIGTPVTVDGSFFGSKDTGIIGFASAGGTIRVNAQSWNDTQITIAVPPDLSPGVGYDVVVTTAGGTSQKTSATKFTLLRSIPNISALEPADMSTNQKVGFGLIVRGSGFFSFTNGSQIHFGDRTPATIYMPPVSGVPAYLVTVIQTAWFSGPGSIPVKVVNSDGGESGTVNFTVINGATLSLSSPVVPSGIPRDGAYHDVSVEVSNGGDTPVKLSDASLSVNGGNFSFTQPAMGAVIPGKGKTTLHWGVKAEANTTAGSYPFSMVVSGKDQKTTTEVVISSDPKSGLFNVLGTATAELLTFKVADNVYREPQPPQTEVQFSVFGKNTGDGDATVSSFDIKYYTEAGTEVPGAFTWTLKQGPSTINAGGGTGEFKLGITPDTVTPGRYKIKATMTYLSPDSGSVKTAEVYSQVFTVRQLAVTITPSITRINTLDTQQFTAVVKDGTTPIGGVTWTLPDGVETGTVDSSGFYTAPAKLPVGLPRVRIRATSTVDPKAYAEVTFAVVLGNLLDSYTVTVNGSSLTSVTKTIVNDVTDINTPVLSVSGGVYTLTMNLVKKLAGNWTGTGLSVSDTEAAAKDLSFPDAWGSVPGPAGYITTAVVYTGSITQASTPVTLRWKNNGIATQYKFVFDVINDLPALNDSAAIDTQTGSQITVQGVNLGDSKLLTGGNGIAIGTLQVPEADITQWSTASGSSTVKFHIPASARTGIMGMKVANYNVINSHKQVTIGRTVVLDIGPANGYPDHEGAIYVHSTTSDKYLFYSGKFTTPNYPELFAIDLTMPVTVTQLSVLSGTRAIKFIHKDVAENFIYFESNQALLRRPPSDLTTATEVYYNAGSPVMGITSTTQALYWSFGKEVWTSTRDIGDPKGKQYTADEAIVSLGLGLIYDTTENKLITPALNGAASELMYVYADQAVPPPLIQTTLIGTATPEPSSSEIWTDGTNVYFPFDDTAGGGTNGPGIYSFPVAGGSAAFLTPLSSATARVSGAVMTGSTASYLYYMYLDPAASSTILRRIMLQSPGAKPEDVAYNVKSGSVPYGIYATKNFVYYDCNAMAICRSPVY
jgi:hypothetical protein